MRPITELVPPSYPRKLETYWMECLRNHFGTKRPDAAISRIAPVVADIADSFTTERIDDCADAYLTPEQILAYGLFFFPRNYARTHLILQELTAQSGWQPPPTPRILDLGCGSGAASLAAADFFESVTPRHTAVDRSNLSLAHLRKLTRGSPRNTWDIIEADFSNTETWASRPGHRWDLILLAYTFNEAVAAMEAGDQLDWLKQLLSRLNPGGVLLIIEPALRQSCQQLGRLRDQLLANKACDVLAPCLHSQNCPMLADKKQWCHEVRRWLPPGYMKRLNQTLHRDIDHLKFSFLALSQGAAPSPADNPLRHRLVSPVQNTRGRLIWKGCAADGQLHQFDLLTRHLDKASAANPGFHRGDIIDPASPKALGGGNQWRCDPTIHP